MRHAVEMTKFGAGSRLVHRGRPDRNCPSAAGAGTQKVLSSGQVIGTASAGSRSMNDHNVFVSAERSPAVVRAVIEATVGAAFTPSQGAETCPDAGGRHHHGVLHDSHLLTTTRTSRCPGMPVGQS